MKDVLYKQRRNLFIKREKFESRLIRYLEKLIIYMNETGKRLPEIPCTRKNSLIMFYLFNVKNGHVVYDLYSNFTDKLFKNMKNISAEELSDYDDILDDFHHALDEHEEEFNEVTSTKH